MISGCGAAAQCCPSYGLCSTSTAGIMLNSGMGATAGPAAVLLAHQQQQSSQQLRAAQGCGDRDAPLPRGWPGAAAAGTAYGGNGGKPCSGRASGGLSHALQQQHKAASSMLDGTFAAVMQDQLGSPLDAARTAATAAADHWAAATAAAPAPSGLRPPGMDAATTTAAAAAAAAQAAAQAAAAHSAVDASSALLYGSFRSQHADMYGEADRLSQGSDLTRAGALSQLQHNQHAAQQHAHTLAAAHHHHQQQQQQQVLAAQMQRQQQQQMAAEQCAVAAAAAAGGGRTSLYGAYHAAMHPAMQAGSYQLARPPLPSAAAGSQQQQHYYPYAISTSSTAPTGGRASSSSMASTATAMASAAAVSRAAAARAQAQQHLLGSGDAGAAASGHPLAAYPASLECDEDLSFIDMCDTIIPQHTMHQHAASDPSGRSGLGQRSKPGHGGQQTLLQGSSSSNSARLQGGASGPGLLDSSVAAAAARARAAAAAAATAAAGRSRLEQQQHHHHHQHAGGGVFGQDAEEEDALFDLYEESGSTHPEDDDDMDADVAPQRDQQPRSSAQTLHRSQASQHALLLQQQQTGGSAAAACSAPGATDDQTLLAARAAALAVQAAARERAAYALEVLGAVASERKGDAVLTAHPAAAAAAGAQSVRPRLLITEVSLYTERASSSVLALEQSNRLLARMRLPGGITYMPVQPDAFLFKVGITWRFPAFVVCLASSYLQRMLARVPQLSEAVLTCPGFEDYCSYLPNAPAVRPPLMTAEAAQSTHATLRSIQFTCLFLATKVADQVHAIGLLRFMLSQASRPQRTVSLDEAANVEACCLDVLEWRLGPFFLEDDLSGDDIDLWAGAMGHWDYGTTSDQYPDAA